MTFAATKSVCASCCAPRGLRSGEFAREIGLPDSELLYRIKAGKAPLESGIAERICRRYPKSTSAGC